MNRLKLDFSIDNVEDRKKFIDHYTENSQFTFNEEELEMMANYILWGKDPSTGKNVVQTHEIEIDTRNKTWSNDDKVESLDALLEQPTFNENQLCESNTLFRSTRETFNREEAYQNAPDHLKEIFSELFDRIDRLELGINFYDLAHSKRIKPPRAELLNKFKPEELEEIKLKAEKWTQFFYLKKRHLLVELRREQFTLRDNFCAQIQRHSEQVTPAIFNEPVSFDSDVPIFPLGTIGNLRTSKIWTPMEDLVPKNFGEEDLKKILGFYWELKDRKKEKVQFNFEDSEHLYQLVLMIEELEVDIAGANSMIQLQGLQSLIDTFWYYVGISNLSELQLDILNKKIKGEKNSDISWYINRTYGKSYSDNYISTLFKQKILKQIAETVSYHLKVVENLSFEEEFKTCSCCGRVLLKDTINFMHKSRSKDGFNSRCKLCDKLARQLR